MKHRKTYAALKEYGFSAYKTLEIILDASRGDEHALLLAKTVLLIMRENAQ